MRRALVAGTALVAALLWTATAFADATPVQLMLVYMPNISNTGTSAASGIAELVMPEGEVRIQAAGLPRLEGVERYVAWLVNSQTNLYYRLGSFNSTEDNEAVHFEDVLPDAIPNKQWNLLLVTVETSAEVTRPSAKHSIAGTFPRSERDPAPELLPNTGGGDDDELSAISRQPSAVRSEWLGSAVLAALVGAIAGSAGYALGRRAS
jgi:hypothetical protein